MTLAEVWRDAMRRARALDPDRIARAIVERADTGIRATTYDRDGGRSANAPCDDPACSDGPDPHSHPTVPDPTGTAALRKRTDDGTRDLQVLQSESQRFVMHAAVVIEYVSGDTPRSWKDVLALNSRLMPGSVQAGLDVDEERVLPHAISQVAAAVDRVERIAHEHLPRDPSEDERWWTSDLSDEQCCSWHLAVEPKGRYRRPKRSPWPCCQDCLALVLLAKGTQPPQWLIEAEVERLAKPRAWTQALGQWLSELGLAETA